MRLITRLNAVKDKGELDRLVTELTIDLEMIKSLILMINKSDSLSIDTLLIKGKEMDSQVIRTLIVHDSKSILRNDEIIDYIRFRYGKLYSEYQIRESVKRLNRSPLFDILKLLFQYSSINITKMIESRNFQGYYLSPYIKKILSDNNMTIPKIYLKDIVIILMNDLILKD